MSVQNTPILTQETQPWTSFPVLTAVGVLYSSTYDKISCLGERGVMLVGTLPRFSIFFVDIYTRNESNLARRKKQPSKASSTDACYRSVTAQLPLSYLVVVAVTLVVKQCSCCGCSHCCCSCYCCYYCCYSYCCCSYYFFVGDILIFVTATYCCSFCICQYQCFCFSDVLVLAS